MKKILILILLIFLLTGCNSYTELNDLGVINMIGIEKINNSYKFYISIISKIDNETKSNIYEIESYNIYNIINKLSLNLNKKIYLSHLDLLIINDSIKTYELDEIISFFLNNNETREDFLVVTSENIKQVLENANFREINDLVKTSLEENSIALYTTMYDVIKSYYNKEPIYYTNIEIDSNIKINKAKIFLNNKYQDIENDKVLFLNYLLNKVNTYKYNLKCDNENVYLDILSTNKSNIKNKIIITNEIKVIKNDCKYDKKTINKLFTNYLNNNLKEFTNKDIKIQNTIRSPYEN
jgi:hypothetical protein